MERWCDVPGFPGYKVSDLGRVWGKSGVILKQQTLPTGYKFVTLYGDVKRQTTVHRLVLESFVGPCPDGMEGCHNDGSKDNNRLDNLRWDTLSNNQLDRLKHGTHNHANKTHCPQGHAFVEGNVRFNRKGARYCGTCKRQRGAADRARRKTALNMR